MIILNIYIILISSITIFLIVVLLFIILLLFAKSKLTSAENVVIKINSDKELIIQQGETLLRTLSNEKIYIPSACGGKGTCGLCKCRVSNGGGSVLPTETSLLSRKEQENQWRLACQVKVKNDLEIILPDSILDIKKYECTVISNNNVATFIKELIVKLPENEILKFQSGEYIQIDVPKIKVNFKSDILIDEKYLNDWNKLNIFNLKMENSEETSRAYSMANSPSENNIIKLNVRITTPPFNNKKQKFRKINPGICSSYIFTLKPNDKIFISGPYGDFHIKDSCREIIFIGGGAGMAPMRSHINDLFLSKHTNRKVSFWYGARSLKEMFYQDDFIQIAESNPNFKFFTALSEPKSEDNWTGYAGFIHQVLFDNYLSKHDEPEEVEYYLCGPQLMTNAVLDMLKNLGVPDEMIAFDDFGN